MHDIRWVINLGNSICGVSILVLPYCFSQCGVFLGLVLLVFSAVLTTWACHLLLDNVFTCRTASYEGIAKELFGIHGKLFIELSSITLNIGCCSAFFVIVKDLIPGIVSWITGAPTTPNMHLIILSILGVTVILPLSLVRNLEPLNFISIGSIIFYVSLTIQLIVLAMMSLSHIGVGGVLNIRMMDFNGIFRALPIYALAFSCHLQLMAMTREVVGEIKESMLQELLQMKWISRGAVILVCSLYGSVSLFGRVAFINVGVAPDVLSNFDYHFLAQVTRCGFAISVLLSFPFMVNPCRATLYSLVYGRSDKKLISTNKHTILTVGIVSIAFVVAVTTPNIAVVVALTGAISGAIICYLFPAISYLKNERIQHTKEQCQKAYVLIFIGVILLTAGTLSALDTSREHHDIATTYDSKTASFPPVTINDASHMITGSLQNVPENVPPDLISDVSDKSLIGQVLTGGGRVLQEEKASEAPSEINKESDVIDKGTEETNKVPEVDRRSEEINKGSDIESDEVNTRPNEVNIESDGVNIKSDGGNIESNGVNIESDEVNIASDEVNNNELVTTSDKVEILKKNKSVQTMSSNRMTISSSDNITVKKRSNDNIEDTITGSRPSIRPPHAKYVTNRKIPSILSKRVKQFLRTKIVNRTKSNT